MRWLTLVLTLMIVQPASANEIDYFCIFANATAAQSDTNVGVFWNATNSVWDTSTTFPGVSVVTPQAVVNGLNPNTAFWIVVSRPIADAGLDANIACVLKLDRDQGVINGSFVLAAAITGSNRTNLIFKPQPMAKSGLSYPNPLGK